VQKITSFALIVVHIVLKVR